MWILYAGGRNVCITGTISYTCCDLREVWLWFVGLQAFLLCCRSNTNEKKKLTWWTSLSSTGLINLQPVLKVTCVFYYILDYSVFCHLSMNTSCFITKSMELGPFWEANSCSPTQIIASILLIVKVHYHDYKNKPLIVILIQMPQPHMLFFQDLF